MKKNLVSTLASPLQQIIKTKSHLLRPLIDATKYITGNVILTKQMMVKPFIKQVLGGIYNLLLQTLNILYLFFEGLKRKALGFARGLINTKESLLNSVSNMIG